MLYELVNSLAQIGLWHGATVAVALGTIAVWAVFRLVKRVATWAMLGALVIVSAVVSVFHISVQNVGDKLAPPSVVPKLSTATGLAYFYIKHKDPKTGVDVW